MRCQRDTMATHGPDHCKPTSQTTAIETARLLAVSDSMLLSLDTAIAARSKVFVLIDSMDDASLERPTAPTEAPPP